MTKHRVKLYTAETEYLEMEISKKEFLAFRETGVPEETLEKLEDHMLYCAPFFDERTVLIVDDVEVEGSNLTLADLYEAATLQALSAKTTRKRAKKPALLSERYIKRAWYELNIDENFDIQNISVEAELLPGKEWVEDFITFKICYRGIPLEFAENYGVDSAETFLRDANGDLYFPPDSVEDEEEDGSNLWIGDEEAARAEMIEGLRDDWSPDELIRNYNKPAAIVEICAPADCNEGLVKSWRFTKKKKSYYYEACRKWPVKTIAIDDADDLNGLESYDPQVGMEIHSRAILPNTHVRLKNFDEDTLFDYKENADESLRENAASRMTEAQLKLIESYYPEIKTVSQNNDWLDISADTPANELKVLDKFAKDYPNDLLGRMPNSTWDWAAGNQPSFAITKITGKISYVLKKAQVIEIRTQQPEYVPIQITEAEFKEFQKNGLPEDVVQSLDWTPGIEIGLDKINPIVYNEHITLLVNGQEVPAFKEFCKTHIAPLLKKGETKDTFDFSLYAQAPQNKRNAWFSLISYQPFDIAKLSVELDFTQPLPNGSDRISAIKMRYDGADFELAVCHTSPERKGAYVYSRAGKSMVGLAK